MVSDSSYYLINVAIGIGIAADAAIATIARARTLRNFQDAIKWACAIGLTHWLFPMIGFLGGWYLASHGIARALVYGVGGGILMTYALRVLQERSQNEPADHASSVVSFWLAVWGVSIDALVTGPGKAAATAHWTRAEVTLSFALVGAVVFVIVLVSAVPATALHRSLGRTSARTDRALGAFFIVATWVEVLVFIWFAMLSTVEAAASMHWVESGYLLPTCLAAVTGAVLLMAVGRRVTRAQIEASRDLLDSSRVVSPSEINDQLARGKT